MRVVFLFPESHVFVGGAGIHMESVVVRPKKLINSSINHVTTVNYNEINCLQTSKNILNFYLSHGTSMIPTNVW